MIEDSDQAYQLPIQCGYPQFQRLPLGDPEELPAATLSAQFDEDIWRNAVAPRAASNLWPQPFRFDIQEPGGSLHGQFEDDSWRNAVAPVPASQGPAWFYRCHFWTVDEVPHPLYSRNFVSFVEIDSATFLPG